MEKSVCEYQKDRETEDSASRHGDRFHIADKASVGRYLLSFSVRHRKMENCEGSIRERHMAYSFVYYFNGLRCTQVESASDVPRLNFI